MEKKFEKKFINGLAAKGWIGITTKHKNTSF